MLAIGNALSGMRFNMARLAASASNIANIDSVSAVDPVNNAGAQPQSAYVPMRAISSDQAGGGVIATYAPARPAWVLRSDPSSRYANRDGMVAAPDVDLAEEMVETLSAKQGFMANAFVLRTTDDLIESTLERWA